ncbi:hypothetical protein K491DRAFT_712723 [Lophiostoma macrostomum CBS 122681]|uniref:Uncharacterized protein n=1 Tax=Lophiostoma macrostomum CBS 122681 TaxID=1314788 RepID=A0A6A6THS3_9PLEO|nr:hypothetical protein K491DRAFT_712723 [Lophiostoma macrostomum CBS 122681]
MEGWAGVDHTYGEQAWLEREGFTAAQGVINMLEVTLYMVYFFIAWRHGKGGVRGAFGGKWAARAVLVEFAAGTITATKTSLYFMREVFSGYKFTGHAQMHPIWTLWGFMNLVYILASSYMMFTFGTDILDGLGIEEASTLEKPN